MKLRLLCVVVLLATSCQTYGMSFTRDSRLSIATPASRSVVRLPVLLRWRVSADLASTIRRSKGEKYYAVFVDRPPIHGGSDISAMVDTDCRRTAGCGDEQWFKDRGVYFTTGTSITIRDVEDKRLDRDREDKDLHRATVVVMRRAEERNLETLYDGTRDSESAVSVEFWVDRSQP